MAEIKIPKGWRKLEGREIVQFGDRCMGSSGKWKRAELSVGDSAKSWPMWFIRRVGKGLPALPPKSALDDAKTLLLLKEPVRRTIVTLRTLSDECECVDDDTRCDLSNMALWLEGVLTGRPAYTSPRDIARARRWARNADKKK